MIVVIKKMKDVSRKDLNFCFKKLSIKEKPRYYLLNNFHGGYS